MRFQLSNLAVTAGLLASTGIALSSHDIPADLPASALLTSAQAHLANGETNEALVYFDAAVGKDPSNYLTLFKRATTYLSLGRTAHATQDFERVLVLEPRFEGAHLQLAKIFSKAARWNSARVEFEAAGKRSDSPELVELAEAEGAARLVDDAVRAAKWDECVNQAGVAILVASRCAALRQTRARCRFERGEIEEGMGDLHHVLQMRPGDTYPHVLISATAFYALADLDNGLAQIRKCLHSDPDSDICKKIHRQQKAIQKTLRNAESQLRKGQSTAAGRTLGGNPNEPGLVTTVRDQIKVLRQHGNIPFKAKAALYDKLVDMTCQAYIESNHKDAIKYCEQALELDPDSFWGLLYRGKTLLKKDQFEAAIGFLNKAAEIRPDRQEKVKSLLNKAQAALRRSKTKDYYKVLGVPRDADQRHIKSAYRKASKLHHPDKAAKQGISKEEAEKKMAAINEAYEVLSDPELRQRFDNGDDPNSQEKANPFQGSPFGGPNPFIFRQQGGPGGSQANFKFHFGGGGPFGF
ncbi:DnaJ and TPR domain protein [Ophiocordyceps camponoti-floridani]|uniref:Tetratricopeptide repeat and J domain-containing co-chaperone DNJ1 n=1 Tax=Ophiocordyceps camponoti-floridani TaxID=2030778 RepID=A0A8H4Q7U7_9HYPO|nr:DnaJ and TPR domain protein [Ophiocordyceps camponoti-floridani]